MARRNRRKVDRSERIGRVASGLRSLGLAVVRLLGALAITAALVASGVALHAWLTASEFFAVARVEIHGAELSSEADLRARTGIAPGDNIFSLNLAEATRLVEQAPWVRRATLTRELPDTVHVLVEERRPVAVVALESLYAVDAGGELFKRVRAGDRLDLPVITGLAREAFIGDKRSDPELRTALLLAERWGASKSAARAELSEVNVGDEGGLSSYVLWVGEPVMQVRLGVIEAGDQETIDAALKRLEQVWDEMERRGVSAATVDLGNRQNTKWVPVKPR